MIAGFRIRVTERQLKFPKYQTGARPSPLRFAVREREDTPSPSQNTTTPPYTISVTGDDVKDGNESEELNRRPDGEGVCQFRFYFSMAAGKVSIEWVDKDNRSLRFLDKPDCDLVR